MASEDPPSIRHTPPDTSTRPISAPPAVDSAAKVPVVNMDIPVDGVPAPQALAQNAGSDSGANGDLPATTGHDKKDTSEAASPGTVKVEPADSGASVAQNVPSIPPDETFTTQRDSPLKEEDTTAALSEPETQKKPDAITQDNIQKLIDERDLAKLEAGVGEALAILDTLQAPLSDSQQVIQRDWLATINDLKQRSNKTRAVVAVVGETGAGKTSLINALLDEDKLLVTSGWRACTAVICEISYNEMDDPRKAYRAEIEFVSQDSWDQELSLLSNDLVEENHLSPDKSDSKTEAGIAYAKIKAVYPDLTDSMIVHHTAKSLAKRASVAEVLGTTRRIECGSASALCSAVQKYMDSKEKSTKMGPRKEKDMAFWPLIKVVRIFCRAKALSTGLVVVDLPGVADSNPARSAIANKYMAECTAMWVVAPIKRATDNKAAKELMGKSSRLQMKLDGIYDNVTFICTMTDAIEFAEALDAFDEDGEIRAKNAREDEIQSMITEKGDTLKGLEMRIQESDQGISELARELQIWRGLRKKHDKGHSVYPPHVSSKRKRPAASQKARSRRQVIDEDSDEDEVVEQPPLTTDDIFTELEKLNNRHITAVDAVEELERQSQALKEDLINLEQEKNDAAVDAARLCVQRRNDVVKKAIGVDFAAGIKDLDIAEAQDDETFDPSVEIRDYDVVANSLPVFAISAKAYQQICRPKKRETEVAGFRTLLDTEIPQLVEHALRLPDKGRIEARRRFLNEVCQLLGSLTIWCTAGDDQLGCSQMSAEDQSWEVKHLRIELGKLREDLDLAIVAQKKELESIVSKEIESRSAGPARQAAAVLEGIVGKWSLKKDAGGRGIHPMTYRSVCRNKGAKTKGATSFDFNEAILEPYLGKLANGWEQAFLRSIPYSLDKFVTTFTDLLNEFHNKMTARQELQKCKKASMRILSKQLDTHSKSLEATIQSMKEGIQTQQRQANRAFASGIQHEMTKAYERCGGETGKGCFTRIKDIMMQHVTKQKGGAMYRKAYKRVSKELLKLFESNREELMESCHTIIDGLQKDFEMILVNSEMLEASEVARDHIRGVLQGVDARFESILSGEPMEVDSAQPPACQPQQLPDVSMVDVEPASGVATETAPSGEDVAMDTAL